MRMSEAEKRGILYVVTGNLDDAVKLRQDATIFGREKGDVLIGDTEISASHCQVQKIDEEFHIFDMNSTNGTYVNNQRILKTKLNDGDLITIGKTTLRFRLEDESNVRHITTIFKTKKDGAAENKNSLVDTLIENELRSTQSYQIILKIEYHDGNTELVELNQRLLYIGRASSFGRFEQDPEISRKHLMVKINDNGEVFIEDQGSTNGSYLNGKKISGMHPVSPDDEVRVGKSNLRITAKSA